MHSWRAPLFAEVAVEKPASITGSFLNSHHKRVAAGRRRRFGGSGNAAEFRGQGRSVSLYRALSRWRKAMLGKRPTSWGEKAAWPVAARLPLRSQGAL